MSELPSGWALAQLADVAQWGSGGTPSRKNDAYFNGHIPWVKTGELGQGIIVDTEEKLTELGVKNSSAKVFPKGSVVVAMYGATIGKAAILGIGATTNQACAVGIPFESLISTKFLFYYLLSQKQAFIEAGKGGAQPNISQTIIKNWPIPLPPLAEQQRIADTLDRLLARVDGCRARLARVPALLKRFRQAVLAAAVTGRLTEDWRGENGFTLPWNTVALPDVAQSRLGKMLDKAKNQGTLTPYLRNINVRWFDFDLTDIQEIRISPAEAESLFVRSGDVLVCEGGEPGRCAVWRGENNTYVFQKALHRVQVGDELLPDWLCYCLKAEADSGRLEDLFTGTTIKHLTGVALARFEFGLPALPEQHEIVRRVETLFAYADRLDARLAAAQASVAQLTPSLLGQAFRGELGTTTTDGESNG